MDKVISDCSSSLHEGTNLYPNNIKPNLLLLEFIGISTFLAHFLNHNTYLIISLNLNFVVKKIQGR